MWQFLLYVGGPIVGAIVNRYVGKLWWWSGVRQAATAILKDPDPTTTSDPKQAVTEAVIKAMLDELAVQARKVQDTFPVEPVVNGSNPYPKVKE